MGSTHFLILSPYSLHNLFLNPCKTLQNPKFSSKFRCSSSSRPNWGSNSDAFKSRRFEFEEEFGRRKKRRNWWSDDDDDDEEDDDDMGFGFWEEPSTAIDWFSKIFGAFGWMIPAIMISTLLGTGSNSLIMAVVLPLGQTALSLVMDKFWGDPPSSRFRSRPRSKSRPRSRSRSRSARAANPVNGGARAARYRPRPASGGYQSWGTATNSSAKNGGRSGSKFGGWDELDQQVPSSANFTERQSQKVNVLQHGGYTETGKLSTRIYREKPLFIRLLVAVFPLLGSWTRFFF